MTAHLTEQQLQHYCEGALAEDREVIGHLHSCAVCREAVRQYQMLYGALKTPPEFVLSDNFADTVMKRLPDEAIIPVTLDRRSARRDLLAVVSAVVAMVIATIIFVGPTGIASFFTRSIGVPALDLSSLVTPLSRQLEKADINPIFLLFALVTLGGVLLVDRIIALYRRHARGRVLHMV